MDLCLKPSNNFSYHSKQNPQSLQSPTRTGLPNASSSFLLDHSASVSWPSCFFSNSLCSELRIFSLSILYASNVSGLLPHLLQIFIPVDIPVEGFLKNNNNRTHLHNHFRTPGLLIPFHCLIFSYHYQVWPTILIIYSA